MARKKGETYLKIYKYLNLGNFAQNILGFPTHHITSKNYFFIPELSLHLQLSHSSFLHSTAHVLSSLAEGDDSQPENTQPQNSHDVLYLCPAAI
jgi:hypothetical protein